MIRIDEEFKALIPPLSPEEFAQLEENCVKEGIRDALVVWPQEDGSDILIDGHNRWKIANKHQELFVNYKRMQFEDRDEAKLWIINKQLGQRNLQMYEKGVLEIKKKDILSKRAKEISRNNLKQYASDGQKSDARGRVDEQIGKRIGASRDTVRKIEVIERDGSDYIKEKVRSGDITINKAYLATKGINDKSPAKLQKEFMDKVKQEHEAFTESKTVSLADVKTDQKHRKIIADDVYLKLVKAGGQLGSFFIGTTTDEIDLEGAVAEWSEDQRENMRDYIQTWMRELSQILEVIN